jgi:hypothetical protein
MPRSVANERAAMTSARRMAEDGDGFGCMSFGMAHEHQRCYRRLPGGSHVPRRSMDFCLVPEQWADYSSTGSDIQPGRGALLPDCGRRRASDTSRSSRSYCGPRCAAPPPDQPHAPIGRFAELIHKLNCGLLVLFYSLSVALPAKSRNVVIFDIVC